MRQVNRQPHRSACPALWYMHGAGSITRSLVVGEGCMLWPKPQSALPISVLHATVGTRRWGGGGGAASHCDSLLCRRLWHVSCTAFSRVRSEPCVLAGGQNRAGDGSWAVTGDISMGALFSPFVGHQGWSGPRGGETCKPLWGESGCHVQLFDTKSAFNC